MELDELYEQQNKRWDALRDEGAKVKDRLAKEHFEIKKAFGFESNIPPILKERMARDGDDWVKEWGLKSERAEALRQQFKQEHDALIKRDTNIVMKSWAFEDNKHDATGQKRVLPWETDDQPQSNKAQDWMEEKAEKKNAQEAWQSFKNMKKDIEGNAGQTKERGREPE